MNNVARVCHVTTVPQSLMFLRGNIGFMKRKGMVVQAISSSGIELSEFGESEQIPVFAVELSRKISPRRDVLAMTRLVSILRAQRPDIVHSHTPKGGLIGMIAAWTVRVPVRVYHIRGLPYMAASGWRRRILMNSERVSCLLADRVFCVSHTIREVAIADGIVPAGKIVVFAGGSGNGVDAIVRYNPGRINPGEVQDFRHAFDLNEKGVTIGYVGRIVRDKGIEELATAWEIIRECYPDARLLLVGPIEPQDPVSPEIINRLRADERVVMTGSLPDVRRAYSVMDLVVLPSYREGLPNVPLEAAAMQIPVVATRIPGTVDAVRDGETGTLVPMMDVQALVTALKAYIDDPKLRAEHGAAGREFVLRNFAQEVIWGAMYAEYRSLLASKGVVVPDSVLS